MSSLSDDGLRNALKHLGFEAGPITSSTRSVYERKLLKLSGESTTGKENRTTISRLKKATTPVKFESESAPPRNSLRSQQWINTSTISDDQPFNSQQISANTSRQELRSRSSLFYSNEPYFSAATASPQQNPGHTPTHILKQFPMVSESNTAPFSTIPSVESSNNRLSKSTNGHMSQEPVSNIRFGETHTPTSEESSTERFSFFSQRSPERETDYSQSGISQPYSPPSSQDQSQLSFWGQRNNQQQQQRQQQMWNRANSGIVSNDGGSGCADSTETEFDPSPLSKWFGLTVHSQIPNIILLCGVILFAVVVSSYFMLKDRHGNVGRIADFQKLVCSTEYNALNSDVEVIRQSHHTCIPNKELSTALKVVQVLFEFLSRYSGEYRCGESSESSRMDLDVMKKMVESSMHLGSITDQVWTSVLILIQEVGRKHLDIAAYSDDGEESTDYHAIKELESLRPYIPGKCRLRLLFLSVLGFLVNLFWVILVLTIVGAICYLIYRVRLSRRLKIDKRESRVHDLVQQVSDLLQQQLQRHQLNPLEASFVPVSVIRATLNRANQDLAAFWNDLEHYVHLEEGCIQVQEWRGLGETWQWQGGTGWQGSALLNQLQQLPFTIPPTECLKIRNMFTMETMDFSGQKRLKRELLKRVADCGPILHIGLDNQDNQGLVYLKCASPEVAGYVYQAIHANYFDSHLLSVKFLRASKYLARFPDAQHSEKPITASDFE